MTVFLPLIPTCVVSLKVLFLVHYPSLCILYPSQYLSPWTITFMLTTHNFLSYPHDFDLSKPLKQTSWPLHWKV